MTPGSQCLSGTCRNAPGLLEVLALDLLSIPVGRRLGNDRHRRGSDRLVRLRLGDCGDSLAHGPKQTVAVLGRLDALEPRRELVDFAQNRRRRGCIRRSPGPTILLDVHLLRLAGRSLVPLLGLSQSSHNFCATPRGLGGPAALHLLI